MSGQDANGGVEERTASVVIVDDEPDLVFLVAILSAHLDADRAEELMYRGAFAAYDKGDLGRLPEILDEDLASFRRVLEGEDDLPPVKRRYRRL